MCDKCKEFEKKTAETVKTITEFLKGADSIVVFAKKGTEVLGTMIGDEKKLIKIIAAAIDTDKTVEKIIKASVMHQIMCKMAKDED